MGPDDKTGTEETPEVPAVIAAEQAHVFEIDLAKTYVVVLSLPAETSQALGNETCAHLTRILADWAENDYPDKFLVVGLRRGASVAFQQVAPHPQAASIRALGEDTLRFYDEPVAEMAKDGHLRLTETGHAVKGADWICPDDCEWCAESKASQGGAGHRGPGEN